MVLLGGNRLSLNCVGGSNPPQGANYTEEATEKNGYLLFMGNFKEQTKKFGYILKNGGIEKMKYSEYLLEYGADETTTPKGVAPRLHIRGESKHWEIWTWGANGNHPRKHSYNSFSKKSEVILELLEYAKIYIEEKNWDAPRFFFTKKDLFEDLADLHQRNILVIKRYFKIEKAKADTFLILKSEMEKRKLNYEKRPSFSKQMMLDYIKENEIEIQKSLKELDDLKIIEDKTNWQIKTNSLIQKVSNNDFRILKWKEIYNLIRESIV